MVLQVTLKVSLRAATKGFKCITVDGGAKLLVGGRELDVISAPVRVFSSLLDRCL